MTVIAFVGSVFSPYYAAARRAGDADPMNFCALNVAIYSRWGGAWVFTEQPQTAIQRGPDSFVLGDSALRWEGDRLVVHIEEKTAPWGRRVAGRIALEPLVTHQLPVELAPGHHWWAVAPQARVKVELDAPKLHFEGSGYHDANWGREPAEDAFRGWTWSRSALRDGTAVLYDVARRGEPDWRRHGWLFRPDGGVEPLDAPDPTRLWGTPLFRMPRHTRGEGRASVLRTVEDAPFYSRSWLMNTLRGERAPAIHESLDLDRFKWRLVQSMLPYRMRKLSP